MDSPSAPSIPTPPKPKALLQQGTNQYIQLLNRFLPKEMQARETYDPLRLAQQQALQTRFGPTQYSQMLQAFQQMDPAYFANRNALSSTLMGALQGTGPFGALTNNLSNAYYKGTPYQQALNSLLPTLRAQVNQPGQYQGQWTNVVNSLMKPGPYTTQWNQLVGQAMKPSMELNQARSLYGDLLGQYNLGTQLTPGQTRELQQQVRGSQAARGNVYGSGAGIEEAYTVGDRGLQLQQQRLQNLQNQAGISGGLLNQGNQFALSALGGAGNYQQQGQQNLLSALGGAGNYALANKAQGMQNYMGALGLGSNMGQQALTNYQGALQQPISNMMGFMQAPTMGQLSGFIPPVTADRSMAYYNPAGAFDFANLGMQGYQAQLGAAAAGQPTGGNPWMSTLGSIGSVIGAVAPLIAMSDRRLKTNVKKVGSVGIYDFKYKGEPGKFRGVMAQEAKKTFPNDVRMTPSGYYGVTQRLAPVQVGE